MRKIKEIYLRGCPSAISIAVIPNDQISLYKEFISKKKTIFNYTIEILLDYHMLLEDFHHKQLLQVPS